MPLYRIIDRLALLIALAWALVFLTMHEYQVALVSLALWPLTRAVISVLDVFFLFFMKKPFVRASVDLAQ